MNKKEKSILEEIQKDIKEIKELLKNPKKLLDGEKQRQYNPNDPATEKQLWRLKNLGIEFRGGITKEEASRVISEHFRNGIKIKNKEVNNERLPDY